MVTKKNKGVGKVVSTVSAKAKAQVMGKVPVWALNSETDSPLGNQLGKVKGLELEFVLGAQGRSLRLTFLLGLSNL
jgi:hypothetical protein